MSATLTSIAWAVCHPRRRPVCDGSRYPMAAGCVHADRTAFCPLCRVDVATVPGLSGSVVLKKHREVKA